jgi:hypothetical protein
MSSVIKIYKAFCDGKWQTGPYTRDKNSNSWGEFWSLLITSGFKFAVDDLVKLKKDNDTSGCGYSSRWHEPGGGHYSLAVRWGNLSFAYAYEKLVGRIPFIGTGLSYDDYPYVRGGTTSKMQGRVVGGCEFMWEGEKVKVTTFRDDEHYLIACAYHPRADGYTPNKIKRRFKITHEMWRAANRLVKNVDKLEAEGVALDFKEGWGYAIRDKRGGAQQTRYYDSTGEVESGKDLKEYTPFKTLGKAYKAAKKLATEGKKKGGK